ncbi:hypothetical protein [Mesomycoplasma ovipneumoniae]|uniref:hypothetical protein n=1 Tax=Mesomycoplasma ovipneumoniae TaxID=29562 RepID=UPI0030800953
MKDIVQLEIDNMSNKVKKQYYKLLTEKLDDFQDWKSIDRSFLGDYEGDSDEDPWEFKDTHTVDELLEVGFRRYPNEFIDFQKEYKQSIYNQTIQENDFKDLGYKDIVPGLSREEKDEIIREIKNQLPYLNDQDYNDVALDKIDKEYIFEYEKLPILEKFAAPRPYQHMYKNDKDTLEKFDQNKYVLTKLLSDHVIEHEFDRIKEADVVVREFFKSEDELIVYVMEDGRMGHEILNGREEYLNPHHQVNSWIETKHQLELTQKDNSEQSQKFEAPKLKM